MYAYHYQLFDYIICNIFCAVWFQNRTFSPNNYTEKPSLKSVVFSMGWNLTAEFKKIDFFKIYFTGLIMKKHQTELLVQ